MIDIRENELQRLHTDLPQINITNLLREKSLLRFGSHINAYVAETERIEQERLHFSESDRTQAIYEDQIEILVRLYHEKLGLDVATYKATIPEPRLLPAEIQNMFPIPIIVEPRIPPSIQSMGMDDDFEGSCLINDVRNVHTIETPNIPYLLWVNSGKALRGYSAQEVRKYTQGTRQRPLTFLEGLALYRAKPEIFFTEREVYTNEAFGIGLAGSYAGEGYVPYLFHNYFSLSDFGEFQVMPIPIDNPVDTVGWPMCYM
jgi:hypothetical protein